MTHTALTRQRQILDAAVQCFARKGFHQTSMDDICKEAKLSPGSVYRYYRSKDDIIAAFVERDSVDSVALITSVGGQADTIAAINSLIDSVLAALDAPLYSQLSLEIAAEAAHNQRIAALVRASDEANVGALAGALRGAQEDRRIDGALDTHRAAELITGLIDGLTWRKGLYPDRDVAAYSPLVKTMIARLLRGLDQP